MPSRSSSPDDVATRLAVIGDDMEVRWTLPRVGELPGMAVRRWAAPGPGRRLLPSRAALHPSAGSPQPLHRGCTAEPQCLSLLLHQAKTELFPKGLDLKC